MERTSSIEQGSTDVGNMELITALIIHYNNGDLLFETILSVLNQNYPRIELIVSDDHSPSFNATAVEEFISNNKRRNIERVVVRQNPKNLGTVKHLEAARKDAVGTIELLIAGDDCWHDEFVFSEFASFFRDHPQAEFVASQVQMCDETLQDVNSVFVQPRVERMLEQQDYQSLKDLLASSCVLPAAGSAYKRSFFEKLGKMSEDYTIVEDWSSHLRWLFSGGSVFYMNRVTVKHRHGGISHSAASTWPSHFQHYCADLEKAFRLEVEPNKEDLSHEAYKRASEVHRYCEIDCLSFENPVSVIVHLNKSSLIDPTLSPLLKQTYKRYEIIVGCREGDVSRIEELLEEASIIPNIERTEVVILDENQMNSDDPYEILSKFATWNQVVFLKPKQYFPTHYALSEIIYRRLKGRGLNENYEKAIGCSPYGEKPNRQKDGDRHNEVASFMEKHSTIASIENNLAALLILLFGSIVLSTVSVPNQNTIALALSIAIVLVFLILLARLVFFFIRRLFV